ncbi:MAG: LTA synthase family protein [Bacteroidota bacterium]
MSETYFQKLKKNVMFSFPYIYGFFCSLLIVRLYEFYSYKNSSLEEGIRTSYLYGGITIDFFFSHFLVFCFVFLFSFFSLRTIKKGFLVHFFSLLTILVSFILSSFFAITFTPLDEIVYQFNIKEIQVIVSGDAFKFSVLLLICAFFAVYFLSFFLFKKIKLKHRGKLIFLCILVLSIFSSYFLSYSSEKNVANKVVNNKLIYFVKSSYEYFSRSEEAVNLTEIDYEFLGGESIDSEYPLIHEFKVDKEFANLFNIKSNKPPNLVFIIVEGLSTHFVGKYAKKTGNIMPFLDSLSEKSIYFPNVISTAQRTFNVLPAVFSSTPNAPEHQSFMKLDFPNHISLISLLKKEYYSRFYCGVFNEFDRMDRYLAYHEVDYQVKKWEKKYNTAFFKSSHWGHPDDQIFDKAHLDLSKKHAQIQKSFIDIFLTISTHGPFKVPNQEKIVQELISDFNKIKNKNDFQKNVIQNAEQYSAYRYADESIRAYFEKCKKDKRNENTIYFILGDHGSHELYNFNELNTISTPLLIVSDLIKKPKTCNEISSHLDILPSVLSLLNYNYKIETPQKVPFMGHGLRLGSKFSANLHQVSTNLSHENSVLIYENYFFSNNQLFQIKENFELKEVKNESLKNKFNKKIKNQNNLVNYLIYNDKIYDKQISKEEDLKLLKFNKIKQLTSSGEFTLIGEKFTNLKNTEKLKIEVNLEFYLKTIDEFKNCPSFTSSIQKYDSTYYWKQTDPVLLHKFKAGWNECIYIIEFNSDEIKNLSNFNVDYVLFNPKHLKFTTKNILFKSFVK